MSEDSKTLPAVGPIDVMRIMEMIPHRYPMLLVDKVEEIIPGESAIGVKNVSMNESFFQGHFPARPVMPGVLIIEALAQTAAVMVVESLGSEMEGKLVYFMSITDAKFRKPVVPGDVVKLHVQKDRARGRVWRFKAQAKVNDQVVCEAGFSAMLADE
ncbi:MAG: 3-hydroxyacyl-ACP dehydratase FabZ [Sphingomonadales bacterium]|nr:3-hydroxyacyl-ACP dehydratase FabZ [Sphingomonadales bacterium]